jgi:hypothetical protein
MRTAGFLVAYASLIGVGLSWITALFYYFRVHFTLAPEQADLRGQLFYNWMFVSGRLTGEARENVRRVHRAMAVFFVCLVLAGGAFIVAAAPR